VGLFGEVLPFEDAATLVIATMRCLFITSSYLRTFLRTALLSIRSARSDRAGISGLDGYIVGQIQPVERDPAFAVEPPHQLVAE
jgi:hypothetical protein